MMRTKRYLFILVAAMVCISFAQGAGKQTLTVWMISWPQPVLDAIDAWAKQNPDIDLKLSLFGSEDLKTQTRLAVDAQKAPDIMMTNAGTTFWEYVDKDAAMDLSPAIAQHKWDAGVNKSYFDVFRRSGRLYAVPVAGVTTWQTLYVNSKNFTDNNVAYPKTVDELIAASNALKKKNIQTIAFGDKDGLAGDPPPGRLLPAGRLVRPCWQDQRGQAQVDGLRADEERPECDRQACEERRVHERLPVERPQPRHPVMGSRKDGRPLQRILVVPGHADDQPGVPD
jgi:ABC-type glycerol-3-phosphate transport system substrate-binding protein